MPSSEDETFHRALSAFQDGKSGDAERLFRKLLAAHPRHVAGLNLLGILLTQLGRFSEAEGYIQRALNENQSSDATFSNYGVILKALKRPAEAFERFGQALAINPSVAQTWNARGTVLQELGRHQDALADFDKALSLDPGFLEGRGNRAKSLAALGSYDRALTDCDEVLRRQPGQVEAWLIRGNALIALERHDDALAAFDRALALHPGLAEAWLGRGNVFSQRRQFDEARAAYLRAVDLAPEFAEAWFNLGRLFTTRNQHRETFSAYDKAFAIRPSLMYVEGLRLYAKLQLCDWANLAAESSQLLAALRSGVPASPPFQILPLNSTPADQLQCARLYLADKLAGLRPSLPPAAIHAHDRIRVAYLSGDLRDHAVAYMLAGVIEKHDRARFEITALSMTPGAGGEFQTRLRRAFDHFIEIHEMDDLAVVRTMREREIDIVVDLTGHTAGSRPEILAHRGAPLQVNYFGYSATMGADFIDYIIGDRVVMPPEEWSCYSEKVVHLPDTFFPTDDKGKIAATAPSRAESGLPEQGFVFCSFNNTYKIAPEMFDIWMRLLHAVEGSVLWQIEGNPAAEANLRREAERRGVAGERLVFAPRAKPEDHLARHRLADLFLDTLPYNAHVSARDALWAGLPLVTCTGMTFASRVAASLLTAAGIPELITRTIADYEALALKLARDPALLSSLRSKLARNRDNCALFDTARYTRHLEATFTTMWQRHQRGEAPQAFTVNSIS